MSTRFLRQTWTLLALLLALPQLAAAQWWQVRDTFTNQIVYPSGTVSMLEDITPPFLANRNYRISNISTLPNLSLGPCSILSTDGSFEISVYPYPAGQSSTTVSPGLPTQISVRHLPLNPGTTQNATVTCSGFGGGFSFQVRGRVLDPNPFIILQTSTGTNVPKNGTFNFGSAQVGSAVLREFRILNMGNQELTVSLSVTGAAYSVATPPPPIIPKGEERPFSLRLLSSTSGTVTGQLRINNNDPNDNPYTVNLTASVSPPAVPQIRVTDNGNGNAVVAKGSTVNIGSTPVNVALQRTFTIANTGTSPLSITNPTSFLSGPGFSLVSSPSGTIGAGSSTQFTIRFQHGTAGTYTGTVSLSNNDPDDNPFTFQLQATATPPAAPRIRIVNETTGQTMVPGVTTVSFGSPAANVAVTHQFRIWNDGTAPLTLSNPTTFVSGTGFLLVASPASTIPAPGHTPFSIRFQAGSSGTYNGAVDLFHNDLAVPRPFHFGLQATIPVDPTPVVTLAVADADAAETAPNGGRFTLTRSGSTALALTVNLSRSGTAADGADYTSIATAQTFAAGQSTLSLPVNPVDDTAIEDVETVTLALAAGAGYTVGSPAGGTVSIFNNDYTACAPAATRLCLAAGRFEATLQATANATSYTGQAFSLGDASGGFWLFSPDNVEVAVKVVDGVAVNGKFWTFHGAATDVAYTLTVRDRANPSQVRTYAKPQGSFCGAADVGAFFKAAPRDAGEGLDVEAGGLEVLQTSALAFTCAPNATTACLLGNRFQVRVLRGGAYQGVVPVTSQTGFFWFFAPDNTEIFVKLLDGRPVNGKFWVFFGSLTDQSYTIEVTDSTTGLVKSYTSPGPLCGGADVNAF